MFVGKRTRFTAAPDGPGVAAVASEPQMSEARFARFLSVELPDGSHRSSHDGNFSLAETVDALFHITHDANGWVPSSERARGIVRMMATATPKSGEQTVVRWVGILVFIDDEGPVLAAKFT